MDFGCGNKPYEHLFICDKYIGVDVYESGHGNENKKVDIFYDGHVLPFDSERFDIILSTQVLEHVQYFDDVFAELVRVLKKNGIFIITVPLASEEHEKPYDFRRFTSFGIKSLFDRYNLELLELKRSTNYKESIRFIKCMYSDNRYRQHKCLKNFVCRYLRCVLENSQFILSYMNRHTVIKDDLTLNFCIIAKKR